MDERPRPVPREPGVTTSGTTYWTAVLAATFCGVAVATNVGKIAIAMPYLRSELGLSLVAAGWVVSMFNTMAVSTGLFFGLISDRFGAMTLCRLGLAFTIVGGVTGILSNTGTLLLLSRFLEGVGFISVAVSAPALVSAASSVAQRRLALSVWTSYMPLGAGVITLLAAPLIGNVGWRGVWWLPIAAAAAALFFIQVNRAAYRTGDGHVGWSRRVIAEALKQPAAWLLGLSFGFYTIQFFAVVIWLPTFLKEQRDATVLASAILTALVFFVNFGGALFGGLLIHRHVRRGPLLVLINIILVGCGAGIFSNSLPDVVRFGLCLALSFIGGIIPTCVLSASAVLARTHQQVSTLQGLFIQGSNLGQFAGPPIVAALVSSAGQWQAATPVMVGAAVCGIAIGLGVWRQQL